MNKNSYLQATHLNLFVSICYSDLLAQKFLEGFANLNLQFESDELSPATAH